MLFKSNCIKKPAAKKAKRTMIKTIKNFGEVISWVGDNPNKKYNKFYVLGIYLNEE